MNKKAVFSVLIALVAVGVSVWAKPEKVEVILKNGKTMMVPVKAAEKLIENGNAAPALETYMITLDPHTSTNDPYGYHVHEMSPDIPLEVVEGESITFTVRTGWGRDHVRVFVNGEYYTYENVTEDIAIMFNK